MQPTKWNIRAAAALSALLLELPFPIAGPMPPWRSVFAWFGLVPLLWAILAPSGYGCKHPRRRTFLVAYLCGVLWYIGNCYWIRDTMMHYGDMPPLAPELLLLGFSLVLGLYFGLFGLTVRLVKEATGSTRMALGFAPFAWAALELAAARITSVPWDQLGYSQVDNALVNQFAPWTGVYGISFLLVAVNALLAGGLLIGTRLIKSKSTGRFSGRWSWGACGLVLFAVGFSGLFVGLPKPAPTATAMLVQPNLDVSGQDMWAGAAWDRHFTDFGQLAGEFCKSFIAGIPQTGAATVETGCPPKPVHPDLVVWPESPAPFFEQETRFKQSMVKIATTVQAPLIVNGIGSDPPSVDGPSVDHVSAMVYNADGIEVGRYDKIHLVPFGEYIPFAKILFFAHKLTGRVSAFTPGTSRPVFTLKSQDDASHRYGVFICYEAVFADEVRHFAANGAEVLVNISDDGWYGDTSAPWQHFNEARMRAIENRRWLLRDTNNGVTAVIDPYGTVRQSIPRHQVDVLPAQFGYRDDVTFYSAHGDVFGWVCVVLSLVIVGWAETKPPA